VASRSVVTLLGCAIFAFSSSVFGQSTATTPLEYTPLSTPCRALDTRTTSTPVQGGTTRTVSPFAGACNISVPADGVIVYAVNVTVVPHGSLDVLTVWAAGEAQPGVSLLNSIDGRTKANAALVSGGTGGNISVYATNTTDLILDVSGYFTETTTGYVYVPVPPCRLIDTRNGTGGQGRGSNGQLQSGPLAADASRTWSLAYPITSDDYPPIGANQCNLPYDVGAAYSVNVTLVPVDGQPVGYASVWGAFSPGATPPAFSNLNATTGTVTANAAIINGPLTLTAYAYNASDVVVDVNGWFAPANLAPQGLSLYPVQPCRALDTREPSPEGVSYPPFPGTMEIPLTGLPSLPCNLPAGAVAPQAFVLNATVVPDQGLPYLTLWPDGTTQQPLVSTLNADDAYITSNMAIVGIGPYQSNAAVPAIQANAPTQTQLVLDESGYFGLNPAATQPTVVFIGDETTTNWPMTGQPTWINKGVAGNTTAEMLARFQTDVIDLHPDVVHIMGGANDTIDETWAPGSQCGPDACTNIEEMVQMAEAAGIRPIVALPLPVAGMSMNDQIELSTMTRLLILNYVNGDLPAYLLDYQPVGGYAGMTSLAQAEIGLASGSPIPTASSLAQRAAMAPAR
jgi:lysophospholipase L1-like esterase